MSHHRFAGSLARYACLLVFLLVIPFAWGRPQPRKSNAAAIAKWRALIPSIEGLLREKGYEHECGGNYKLRASIVDAANLTGDGPSIALVDYCPGGAYTDWIVVMQLEEGRPAPARFRKANGELTVVGFAQGASVMHGMNVKLVPELSAVYGVQWDNDETLRLKRCIVDAYVWNAKTKTFDWDKKLSRQAKRSYCRSLQQQLLEQH